MSDKFKKVDGTNNLEPREVDAIWKPDVAPIIESIGRGLEKFKLRPNLESEVKGNSSLPFLSRIIDKSKPGATPNEIELANQAVSKEFKGVNIGAMGDEKAALEQSLLKQQTPYNGPLKKVVAPFANISQAIGNKLAGFDPDIQRMFKQKVDVIDLKSKSKSTLTMTLEQYYTLKNTNSGLAGRYKISNKGANTKILIDNIRKFNHDRINAYGLSKATQGAAGIAGAVGIGSLYGKAKNEFSPDGSPSLADPGSANPNLPAGPGTYQNGGTNGGNGTYPQFDPTAQSTYPKFEQTDFSNFSYAEEKPKFKKVAQEQIAEESSNTVKPNEATKELLGILDNTNLPKPNELDALFTAALKSPDPENTFKKSIAPYYKSSDNFVKTIQSRLVKTDDQVK